MIEQKNLNKDEKIKPPKKEGDVVGGETDSEGGSPEGHEQHEDTLADPTPASSAEEESLGEGGVVRAETSKIALRGLKVVGKIDLPQTKQKSKDADVATPPSADQGRTTKEYKPKRRVTRRQTEKKPGKTRVQAQGEKLQQARKEKRKQRYHEKVSNYQFPIKPLKRENESDYEVYNEEEDRPKNWLRRFFHWFTAH